jgi:hypothetical protein
MGAPIAMPGNIHDAAPVPGGHRVAVAHAMGISIVDLDTMNVATGMGPSVDRVTVGPTTDGHLTAYGLVGRVAPPAGPVDPCMGTSSIVTVDVDTPMTASMTMLSDAVSDIAASPDTPTLFAALPCTGKISRVDGTTLTDVSSLERAAVLVVAGERIWAAGTKASTPHCVNGSGTAVACTASATAECPMGATPVIDYVSTGGHLVVQSIPIDGGMPVELDLPEPRETMVSTDDPAAQHAQVLRALAITPLDLVTLPGGQYVALVMSNTYYINALSDSVGILLPCLRADTSDWLLLDMASSSTAQRVRTQCDLTVGPVDSSTPFPKWACEDAPEGQKPTLGEFQPVSVGALFGAR